MRAWLPRHSLHSLVLHPLDKRRGFSGNATRETCIMRLAGFVPAVSMRYTLAAMQTDELLTYEELGELLRLKKTAMAAAKRRGDLPPAIRIGRKNLRWRRATVEAWLREREAPVTIDPVFAERSARAVAARRAKNKSRQGQPALPAAAKAAHRLGGVGHFPGPGRFLAAQDEAAVL